LVRFCGGLSN